MPRDFWLKQKGAGMHTVCFSHLCDMAFKMMMKIWQKFKAESKASSSKAKPAKPGPPLLKGKTAMESSLLKRLQAAAKAKKSKTSSPSRN